MKIRQVFISILLFFFGEAIIFAQIPVIQDFKYDFIPSFEYAMDSLSFSEIVNRFEVRGNSLKENQSKKACKLIDEMSSGVKNMMKQLDSLNLLMYNDTLTNYLNTVLKKIIKANPEFKDNHYVLFVRRSAIPNAADWGEGVIFVSLDILCRLNNESEIAYVICHELAHDYNDHIVKRIKQTVDLLTDKEFTSKLKKVSKQEYNKINALDDLLYRVTSERSTYSRKDEIEADSLGLVFCYNAGYSPNNAESTLRMLDSLDNPLFKKTINFKTTFSFPDLPFDESSIYEDTTDLNWQGNIDYKIPDSLKTHPDCKFRADNIHKVISSLQPKSTQYYNKNLLYYNAYSVFELVQHFSCIEYYSAALYFTLSLQEIYPENIYLKCMVVDCLFGITEALKNHTFSRSVDLPSNEQIEAYNELLRFLNNANYSELNNLLYKYYEANVAQNKKNNAYAYYLDILLKSRESKEQDKISNWVEEYKSIYANNVYTQKLKKYFNPN